MKAASPLPRCSDNLRGFFEQCFPTLLKRLFGYDGMSWLNLVAQVGGVGRLDSTGIAAADAASSVVGDMRGSAW